MKLSKAMTEAVELAWRNGGVFAGKGNGVGGGGLVSVASSTIKALAARKLVDLGTSPDGDTMGTLTPDGVAHYLEVLHPEEAERAKGQHL